MHDDIRPQLAEIMNEIEGEAVIVVDQDNHAPGQRFSRSYGEPGRGSRRRRQTSLSGDPQRRKRHAIDHVEDRVDATTEVLDKRHGFGTPIVADVHSQGAVRYPEARSVIRPAKQRIDDIVNGLVHFKQCGPWSRIRPKHERWSFEYADAIK